MRVEVTWVADGHELARIRERYVGRSTRGLRDAATSRRDTLHGFTVLGKRDGEQVCLVYAFRPERVDDDRTTALGHELLHCLAGAYHE